MRNFDQLTRNQLSRVLLTNPPANVVEGHEWLGAMTVFAAKADTNRKRYSCAKLMAHCSEVMMQADPSLYDLHMGYKRLELSLMEAIKLEGQIELTDKALVAWD